MKLDIPCQPEILHPGGNFVQYIHLNINPFYILSHGAKNAISWVTENEQNVSFCVLRHHRHIKLWSCFNCDKGNSWVFKMLAVRKVSAQGKKRS